MARRKSLLIVGLLCITTPVFAQQLSAPVIPANSTSGQTWKNRVSRLVMLGDTTGVDKGKYRKPGSEKCLMEILAEALLKGELTAYSNIDSKFTTPLSKEQVTAIFLPVPDTMRIEDPVTKKMITRLAKKTFEFNVVEKYRVLEEWVCDRQTGKTNIQLIGIGPVVNFYDFDGNFRTLKTLFWLKYDDVKDIINKYDSEHPKNNIALALWRNYVAGAE